MRPPTNLKNYGLRLSGCFALFRVRFRMSDIAGRPEFSRIVKHKQPGTGIWPILPIITWHFGMCGHECNQYSQGFRIMCVPRNMFVWLNVVFLSFLFNPFSVAVVYNGLSLMLIFHPIKTSFWGIFEEEMVTRT